MWICQLIFVVYFAFLAFKFRKAALALFPCSLLMTTLPLVTLGTVVVGLNFALQTLFCMFYLFRKRISWKFGGFPFKTAMAVSCAVIVLCALFGESRTPFYIIISSLLNTIMPLLIWPLLNRKENICFVIKSFVACLLVIVGYGLIEFLLQKNVLLDYIQSTTSVTIYHSHIDDVRFGFGRCSSLFDFPIPFGDVCAMFFCFFALLYKHSYAFLSGRLLAGLLVACSVGVVLANSRASLVAYLIGWLLLLGKFNIKSFLLLLVAFSFLYMFGAEYISANIASMTGEDDIGGSSSEARVRQLQISIMELMRNPFFGGGESRISYAQDSYWGSYGLESVVFVLMIGKGLTGLCSYFYTYISLFVKVPQILRTEAFIIATSWVVAACFSLTTGVDITFPMILVLVVIKASQFGIIKIEKNGI